MYNITVIFTIHKEIGKCNSIELQKIIEKINPEIIFEELSFSTFNEVYKEKKLITLESNAIKKHLLNYKVKHIPVDTYNLPSNYYRNIEYMYDKIIKSIIIESRDFRYLLDKQSFLTRQDGFNYLNSNQNDELLEESYNLKEKILNIISDKNLFSTARLEKEVLEKRENEIINNIYNFSKENIYHQAILFIGSGHRKSIIKKIEKMGNQEKIEINWKLYINNKL